ncbi:MAG: hypothetical protein M1530_00830 [Candidatus Marsarchaeota archaeon]|nr:hypothetical protein [Candidatus Marsarchaeota archaeon]
MIRYCRKLPGRSLKGQYFSMDAIIASIIFVLALSLLMSHWFSLRAQNESRSSVLQDDADRLSTLIISPPDPPAWYKNPSSARTAGLALNNSRLGVLNLTAVSEAAVSLDPRLNLANYNAARALMVTPAEFYIIINTTPIGDHSDKQLPLFYIGRAPVNAKEIAIMRRGIVIPETGGSQAYYHYGTLTLMLWSNTSAV